MLRTSLQLIRTRVSRCVTNSAHALVENELNSLFRRLEQELWTWQPSLRASSLSLFSRGGGKAIRPVMALLMARTCNRHVAEKRGRGSGRGLGCSRDQCTVAMVSEMIHSASLIHDDVIDKAEVRRGFPALHTVTGEREAVLTGTFILARASSALSRISNTHVVELLSRVIEDLITGEVMQLSEGGRGEDLEDTLEQYMEKTFRKTASLMAYSCQAVAELAECTEEECEVAFSYGRHAGLAFQLVDDALDFRGTVASLGKPALVDLSLGLATAPSLLAAREFPEMKRLIERQFSESQDIETAIALISKSGALVATENLARDHAHQAVSCLQQLQSSQESAALMELARDIVDRQR